MKRYSSSDSLSLSLCRSLPPSLCPWHSAGTCAACPPSPSPAGGPNYHAQVDLLPFAMAHAHHQQPRRPRQTGPGLCLRAPSACRYLVNAAQLLAPLVSASGAAADGFDWCCDTVSAAGFSEAAASLAGSRPGVLLHWGQHAAAVQALKVLAPFPRFWVFRH